MKKFMTLVFVLLMAGCMQAPQTDLEGLKAMVNVMQSAFDSRDPAAIAAFYAEDGVGMPPNTEATIGREAIEDFWREFLDDGMDPGVATVTDVYAHGDVGYDVGTYAVTDSGGAIDMGKYVRIWRHGDGKWQLHYVIWNSDLPLSAPEPKSASDQETLYQRLGGYDVVAAILDNWGPRVFDDPELSLFLTDINEDNGKERS